MKLILLLLLLLLLQTFLSPFCSAYFSTKIKTASYNIRSGTGGNDVKNLTQTALAILALDVEVIGLQEVDNITDRNPVDQVCSCR